MMRVMIIFLTAILTWIPAVRAEANSLLQAMDDVEWNMIGGIVDHSYSGSGDRRGARGAQLFIGGSWLDRAGVTLGAQRLDVSFSGPAIRERELQLFAGGFVRFHRDDIPGTLTAHVSLIRLEDRTAYRIPLGGGNFGYLVDNSSSEAMTMAVSCLPYSKQWYAALEYARYTHHTDGNLSGVTVQQISPTAGLGFNDLYDWLQLQLIRSEYANGASSMVPGEQLAARLSWSHWFKPGPGMPDSISTGIQGGEALLTVDTVSGTINTLPDTLIGAVTVSANWKLSDHATGLLLAGRQRYRRLAADGGYDGRTLYMNMALKW